MRRAYLPRFFGTHGESDTKHASAENDLEEGAKRYRQTGERCEHDKEAEQDECIEAGHTAKYIKGSR